MAITLDAQIELETLRLYGLPEGAPTLLCGTPTLPVGQREFAVETTLDLPSLAGGAVLMVIQDEFAESMDNSYAAFLIAVLLYGPLRLAF